MGLLETIYESTFKYLQNVPKKQRKEIGQFFTTIDIAKYMVSMFDEPRKDTIRLLDPGAGSGILSAAAIERLQACNVQKVQLVCYETSEEILPLLRTNIDKIVKTASIVVDAEIREKDYLISQKDQFQSNKPIESYDWIIGNPPYLKIGKDAPEALSMPVVCYGAPNMYFLFLAMSVFNAEDKGEIVYIIPRSWTSGAYFERFRKYLFQYSVIESLHLFVSRNQVFEKEDVLQETIIVKFRKSGVRSNVRVTCTRNGSDFDNTSSLSVPYQLIVSGPRNYVYLITNKEELEVLSVLAHFHQTLPDIGFQMHTGLTIDFRNRDVLRDEESSNTVPFFYSQHIQGGIIDFPIHKKYQYLSNEKKGLLQENKNYLFVKRFSAKEEPRRLQSGIYLASKFPNYDYISTQNKVNFISANDFEMTDELVYGLYVLFNSTLYDQYYRILNGSTQVNSTEINAMPVPTLQHIYEMGTNLIAKNDFSVTACDEILGGICDGKD